MGKTVSINNYKFFYEENGSGEKAILIHGSSSDYRTWKQQIGALSNDYHVIAYSRRYHWPNKRIKAGDDYSMNEHVEDLKLLIEHFGSDPVHIIGHSYGALMGIELACTNPDLVKSMVLAEPPAIRLFVSNAPKLSELLSLLFRRFHTAISIVRLGATGIVPATKAAKKNDMTSAMQVTGKAILGKEYFDNLTKERKEQALINLSAAELTGSGFLPIYTDRLRMIKFPVLLVGGKLSPKVFGNLLDRLGELIPNVKRVAISEASHIMHEDNVAEYNSKIASFLRRRKK